MKHYIFEAYCSLIDWLFAQRVHVEALLLPCNMITNKTSNMRGKSDFTMRFPTRICRWILGSRQEENTGRKIIFMPMCPSLILDHYSSVIHLDPIKVFHGSMNCDADEKTS